MQARVASQEAEECRGSQKCVRECAGVLPHGGLAEESLDLVGVGEHGAVAQLLEREHALGLADEDLGLALLVLLAQGHAHVVQDRLSACVRVRVRVRW